MISTQWLWFSSIFDCVLGVKSLGSLGKNSGDFSTNWRPASWTELWFTHLFVHTCLCSQKINRFSRQNILPGSLAYCFYIAFTLFRSSTTSYTIIIVRVSPLFISAEQVNDIYGVKESMLKDARSNSWHSSVGWSGIITYALCDTKGRLGSPGWASGYNLRKSPTSFRLVLFFWVYCILCPSVRYIRERCLSFWG